MLIALTFLGTGNYQETTYIKHDDETKTCETDLFPIAVARLYKPDQIIAFTTPRVIDEKQDDLNRLKNEFGDKFSTEEIPNGNSPEELWEIFNNCINVFKDKNENKDGNEDEDNDGNENKDVDKEIILDITHAFRSIPLLIFIVAAYLRQVKNIKLKYIIYGAFEARNEKNNETPIFDLTPFVELLDWMNAVNVFQNSGDARPIAGLGIPGDIPKALTDLSEALLTNRTLEAQSAAMTFNRTFSSLPFDELQAPPFQMLVKQLKQSYQQMAVYEPHNNREKSLKAQYQQIKWYIRNQHYLQAITLMREWLISYECFDSRARNWRRRETRENAADNLKDLLHNPTAFSKLGQRDRTLSKLWDQCIKIRNDLAHCGMQNPPPPRTATQAIQAIKELFSEFEDFVEEYLI